MRSETPTATALLLTGNRNDLFRFDPMALAWTDLTASVLGSLPSPRDGHGFTAAGDALYLFGGIFGGTTGRCHSCPALPAVVYRYGPTTSKFVFAFGFKITISRGGVLAHHRGFGTCGWTGISVPKGKGLGLIVFFICKGRG
jgi:hypothetical protein